MIEGPGAGKTPSTRPLCTTENCRCSLPSLRGWAKRNYKAVITTLYLMTSWGSWADQSEWAEVEVRGTVLQNSWQVCKAGLQMKALGCNLEFTPSKTGQLWNVVHPFSWKLQRFFSFFHTRLMSYLGMTLVSSDKELSWNKTAKLEVLSQDLLCDRCWWALLSGLTVWRITACERKVTNTVMKQLQKPRVSCQGSSRLAEGCKNFPLGLLTDRPVSQS